MTESDVRGRASRSQAASSASEEPVAATMIGCVMGLGSPSLGTLVDAFSENRETDLAVVWQLIERGQLIVDL